MANLFFIHTPFQLFVAQQIISQEQLKHNIMLYGYYAHNKQFLRIYDFIKIQEMWDECHFVDNISCWPLFDFRNIRKCLHNIKQIDSCVKKLIHEYKISSVFLGDINNQACQLLSFVYARRGLNVCFFEEGTSHYVNGTNPSFSKRNTFIRYCKSFLSNLLLYKRYWKISFGKNVYINQLNYNQLPITARFSIIPFYHEYYDIRLCPTRIFSTKTSNLIKEEINGLDTSNSILFLSEPITERCENAYEIELDVIKRYFSSINKKTGIILKFHPRETQKKKEDVMTILNNLNLNYRVIGSRINIPVEYYLQFIDFKSIVTFFASTCLYKGYIFKDIKVDTLLPELYTRIRDKYPEFGLELKKRLNNQSFIKVFGDKYESISK